MKQLLTWCGSRALPAKPSGNVKNANAIMAGMLDISEVRHRVLIEVQRERYNKSS